ncbi:proline-rich protein 1-like [Quillaja saponaria]|uniref:Proline-rich protein 1-like n=1 Tax=Quillaja saponaria TaxID=32244 RepID=A0AAD7P8P6_QUISA|nr:proline-rich protein 1-like [Quillaja saponaria]KAJ7946750.1 proline-rich protein 1-like [Quillaja saponaria]
MASYNSFILAFFIALSFSNMDISIAARSLLQTTQPAVPNLPVKYLPIPTSLPLPTLPILGNIVPPLPPIPSLPVPALPAVSLPVPSIHIPTISSP